MHQFSDCVTVEIDFIYARLCLLAEKIVSPKKSGRDRRRPDNDRVEKNRPGIKEGQPPKKFRFHVFITDLRSILRNDKFSPTEFDEGWKKREDVVTVVVRQSKLSKAEKSRATARIQRVGQDPDNKWGYQGGPDKQWENKMIEKVVDAELARRAHVTGEGKLKAEDNNLQAFGKVDKEPSLCNSMNIRAVKKSLHVAYLQVSVVIDYKISRQQTRKDKDAHAKAFGLRPNFEGHESEKYIAVCIMPLPKLPDCCRDGFLNRIYEKLIGRLGTAILHDDINFISTICPGNTSPITNSLQSQEKH
ncbi:(Dimethylallyl)adenosine tRNAmethylthiotransferase MiaB [Striga asiatica]|uniref:(Dimethylallyl)adenosine tRNAmethylthiotransferase MiaB n=1 Tax=Striga asiatica TaxID=4170 RepID=A0A5A7PCM9_STRAF|nr:(Dimethylallyl)adenosine tRNAmethylthiotransferase MiaB [Striga asiatica]